MGSHKVEQQETSKVETPLAIRERKGSLGTNASLKYVGRGCVFEPFESLLALACVNSTKVAAFQPATRGVLVIADTIIGMV